MNESSTQTVLLTTFQIIRYSAMYTLNLLKQVTAIFLYKNIAVCRLQYQKYCSLFYLARLVYITLDNFPADKKDRPRFPQTVVLASKTAIVDLMKRDNNSIF